MKKRLLVIFAFVCLLLLAGCDFSKKDDSEVINQGYSVIVNFDANGGKIGNYKVRHFYFQPGSLIVSPGDGFIEDKPAKQGYVLSGWYYGEKDEEGNVTFGEQFNFETDRVNESITLYAKWSKYYTYTILYGYDTTTSTYARQTVLSAESSEEIISKPSNGPSWPGHTFLGYYEDAEFTTPFDWTKQHAYDENQNHNLYAKFLTGNFVLVDSPQDLENIKATTNLYLLNDIDCTGVTTVMPLSYSGKIYGNGHTISNMTIVHTQNGTLDTNYALFNNLVNATIEDVTFDHVTITSTVGIGNNLKAGIFACSIKGSTIKNVTISNVVQTITLSGSKTQSDFSVGNPYVDKDSASVIDELNEENNEIIFN